MSTRQVDHLKEVMDQGGKTPFNKIHNLLVYWGEVGKEDFYNHLPTSLVNKTSRQAAIFSQGVGPNSCVTQEVLTRILSMPLPQTTFELESKGKKNLSL